MKSCFSNATFAEVTQDMMWGAEPSDQTDAEHVGGDRWTLAGQEAKLLMSQLSAMRGSDTPTEQDMGQAQAKSSSDELRLRLEECEARLLRAKAELMARDLQLAVLRSDGQCGPEEATTHTSAGTASENASFSEPQSSRSNVAVPLEADEQVMYVEDTFPAAQGSNVQLRGFGEGPKSYVCQVVTPPPEDCLPPQAFRTGEKPPPIQMSSVPPPLGTSDRRCHPRGEEAPRSSAGQQNPVPLPMPPTVAPNTRTSTPRSVIEDRIDHLENMVILDRDRVATCMRKQLDDLEDLVVRAVYRALTGEGERNPSPRSPRFRKVSSATSPWETTTLASDRSSVPTVRPPVTASPRPTVMPAATRSLTPPLVRSADGQATSSIIHRRVSQPVTSRVDRMASEPSPSIKWPFEVYQHRDSVQSNRKVHASPVSVYKPPASPPMRGRSISAATYDEERVGVVERSSASLLSVQTVSTQALSGIQGGVTSSRASSMVAPAGFLKGELSKTRVRSLTPPARSRDLQSNCSPVRQQSNFNQQGCTFQQGTSVSSLNCQDKPIPQTPSNLQRSSAASSYALCSSQSHVGQRVVPTTTMKRMTVRIGSPLRTEKAVTNPAVLSGNRLLPVGMPKKSVSPVRREAYREEASTPPSTSCAPQPPYAPTCHEPSTSCTPQPQEPSTPCAPKPHEKVVPKHLQRGRYPSTLQRQSTTTTGSGCQDLTASPGPQATLGQQVRQSLPSSTPPVSTYASYEKPGAGSYQYAQSSASTYVNEQTLTMRGDAEAKRLTSSGFSTASTPFTGVTRTPPQQSRAQTIQNTIPSSTAGMAPRTPPTKSVEVPVATVRRVGLSGTLCPINSPNKGGQFLTGSLS